MRRLAATLVVLSIVALVSMSAVSALPTTAPTLTTTPTRSGIFLPLVSNPPTLTPTNTATATPITQRLPILPNHSAYTNNGSNLHIVGEVLNDTGGSVNPGKISVDVFNGAQLVATGYTYTDMSPLRSGDKACFKVLMTKPAAWTSYQFKAVPYSPTTRAPPNLTLLNVSTNSGRSYHINGQIRNDSGVQVSYVQPIATIYSANGTVLDCYSTFADNDILDPGQTSDFTMNLFSRLSYADAASYRVQVWGYVPYVP